MYAVAARGAGGTPYRAYTLTVATSTGPVAVVGAADTGGEPGTCAITWANAPLATVESGSEGFSLAPFNPPPLQPGYTIVGRITSPVAGDAWLSATAWYDYVLSAAP